MSGDSYNPAFGSATGTDHGALSDLLTDDHTQYLLLAGRSGGQIAIGGTGSGDNLTLQSTSNATKGVIEVDDVLRLDPIGVAAGNTNEIRFLELAANGVNYVGFKGADTIASNVIWTLPAADGASGEQLTTNGAGVLSWAAAGVADHGGLTGLLDDDHTNYALLAGRSTGQTLIGGTASGDDLTLQSTANATRGSIFMGGTDWEYSEVTDTIIHTSTSTTVDVYSITADSLTTGGIANFVSNSADASVRNLVTIHNDNIAASGTHCLELIQDSGQDGLQITMNEGARAINITHLSEAAGIDFDAIATTTGSVINAAIADALTTGKIINAVSDSADASARDLVLIHNDNASATGTTVLRLLQDSTGLALHVDSGGSQFDGNVGFYGTTPVAQSAAYTRNTTVVEDRTLLASASATVTNNNNVLAALIADLQATGLIG